MADGGSQKRKPGIMTAVADAKALATVLTTEAESLLGRRATQILSMLVLFAVVLGVLFALLNWYIAPSGAEQKQALIVTLAQILGGTALLSGLYFTWRTLQVNREAQITERFTRAIDQLGSAELEIRLGGIYALERIARDSERDHWPIIEVLTAYVRQHARRHPKNESSEDMSPAERYGAPKPDIQAILSVIGRRSEYHTNREVELGPIDLRGSNLRGANLKGANLKGAILTASDLSRADMREADLRKATLYLTILEGARLDDTKIQGTNLRMAKGLKKIQIMRAEGDEKTNLPNDISRPTKWNEQSS